MPDHSATTYSDVSNETAQKLRRLLTKWYARHHRPLPWRAKPGENGRTSPTGDCGVDPYHVLLSETMLQQTQVATVVPYFERFVAALPTLASLADADEQQVLRLWQGLGYYRRARNLQATAKRVVEEHAGALPRDVASLRNLPGVGDYTAGAIASIAFGEREPVLDGNVARVLARWFAIGEPIDAPATKKALWSLARQFVPRKAPGDWNQAVMELGATVCTPRNPQCLTCPVAAQCEANHRGIADELPRKLPRRQPKSVRHDIVAVEHRRHIGSFLFEQRPASGLWNNMWQMPTCEEASEVAETALLMWLCDRFGLRLHSIACIETFTHQTTHRTIEFHLWRGRVGAGRLRPNTGVWRRLDKFDDLPLANPQRHAIAMLQQETQ